MNLCFINSSCLILNPLAFTMLCDRKDPRLKCLLHEGLLPSACSKLATCYLQVPFLRDFTSWTELWALDPCLLSPSLVDLQLCNSKLFSCTEGNLSKPLILLQTLPNCTFFEVGNCQHCMFKMFIAHTVINWVMMFYSIPKPFLHSVCLIQCWCSFDVSHLLYQVKLLQ